MPRIASVELKGLKSLTRAVLYLSAVIILIAGIGELVAAGELRPYSLPSQKMDNPGQYQQRRVEEKKVDESFYENFERNSKKYDAKKKAKTNAYLNDKLKKSKTDTEVTHYRRLLSILNDR